MFSSAFIYNQINGGSDDGGTLEDAGNLIENVGAATLKDFYWWSGLSAADSSKALGLVRSGFISETVGTEIYWMANSFQGSKEVLNSAFLLPAYDEFLISYRDRSASLTQSDNDTAISANGIFRPVILVRGKVKGVWNRMTKGDKVIVGTEFFQSPGKTTRNLLEKEVYRFGKFLNKKTSLHL